MTILTIRHGARHSLIVLALILGSIAGCATAPTANPWLDIEVDTEAATRPLSLPEFPSPASVGMDTVTFDIDGANAISAYIVTAEANTGIAEENASQVDELNTAAGHLVEAGKAQRTVADLRLEILEEERRHWFWEKTGYWAGFIMIGLAVAL